MLQERLFELQDLDYRAFHSRLIPNVAPEQVIGVRTPALRKLTRAFAKEPEAAVFMRTLPHAYYEENCVHGFLIEQIQNFDSCIAALDAFLPYVDNWATCDLMSPKVLKTNLSGLLPHIRRWISSNHTYTIRFGMLLLLRYYLDEVFESAYLELVADVCHEDYYVRMMQAWFFAEALVKQKKAALPWLEQQRLEPWTHNKAIQKAVESFRITPEEKAYYKTLRIQRRSAR